MLLRRCLLYALVPICLLLVAPANAATVVYTDRALFEAAIGAHQNIDFTSAPNVVYHPDSRFVSITYDNQVKFSGEDIGYMQYVTGSSYPEDFTLGLGGISSGGQTVNAVTAFGFDIARWNDARATITLFGVGTFTASASAFLGFTSDVPLIARVSAGGTIIGSGFPPAAALVTIDNVIVQAVPEPSTLFLSALGLLALGHHRRRTLRRDTTHTTMTRP